MDCFNELVRKLVLCEYQRLVNFDYHKIRVISMKDLFIEKKFDQPSPQ